MPFCRVVADRQIGQAGAAGNVVDPAATFLIVRGAIGIAPGDGKPIQQRCFSNPDGGDHVVTVVCIITFCADVAAQNGFITFPIPLFPCTAIFREPAVDFHTSFQRKGSFAASGLGGRVSACCHPNFIARIGLCEGSLQIASVIPIRAITTPTATHFNVVGASGCLRMDCI